MRTLKRKILAVTLAILVCSVGVLGQKGRDDKRPPKPPNQVVEQPKKEKPPQNNNNQGGGNKNENRPRKP